MERDRLVSSYVTERDRLVSGCVTERDCSIYWGEGGGGGKLPPPPNRLGDYDSYGALRHNFGNPSSELPTKGQNPS